MSVSRLKEILWVLAFFGVVGIVARLLGGLGATTGLSDAMPWGLWKIMNMVAGVALGTGGFVMAATIYVFHLKKYESLSRPAILIALLGYGSSCFALFLDIGLPHMIWKPLVFWNPRSFLFEVSWCVMLYFSVTIFETAPVVLERFKLTRLIHLLHKITIPIVIFGVTLSTLHHSSLGSLFLAMPARLHVLWFTPWLPLLFIVSAIGAGLQMLILVTLGYSHFYRRPANMPMLASLARVSAVFLGLYLVVKIADLVSRGQIGALFSGQWETGFFVTELLLGCLIPVGLIIYPRTRNRPAGLAAAAASAIAGLILNRLDVGILGLLRTADQPYMPTYIEFAVSIGVVAMAGLVFLFMVENFAIFESVPAKEFEPAVEASTHLVPAGFGGAYGSLSGFARVSILATITIPIAVALFSNPALAGITHRTGSIHSPLAADAARKTLTLDADRNGIAVMFHHQDHKDRLGGDKSCAQCHHMDAPGDKSSSCSQCHTDMWQKQSIFKHDAHVAALGDKWSCEKCHTAGQPKDLDSSKACVECHKGMTIKTDQNGRADFMADSYADAMHGQCVSCHQQQDQKKGEKKMAECNFCHKDSAVTDLKQFMHATQPSHVNEAKPR